MSAIEVKQYRVAYGEGETPVLEDCSLTLDYGEFVLLSGLSGSGKSTLLSSINGMIPNAVPGVQSGEILVDGESVLGKKISEISRRVGSVLQNADSQIVHIRVEDEIAFGCENRNLPRTEIRNRVEEACRMMQLDKSWATQTLSGGQKQRLITASTLAMGQKILVFDEPLANLDTEGAHMLLKLLKKLTREEGYAVLFVEHRLDVVLPYVDRVLWMENRRIREIPEHEWDEMQGRGRLTDDGAVPASKKSCLKAEHVAFRAGKREILKDISFELYQGERLVILGENGCGKTTLLKILARLQKSTGGIVRQELDEKLGRKGSAKWFRTAGYVYQNPNYQLFMPQVESEIGYQSESRENTTQCMEEFDLEELAERHPQSLSEGQKRRVSIAAIAAGRPRLLFLDEPTVGQDFQNLKRMVETVNAAHKATGMTMITVTHDVRCADALADRVLWIRNGVVYKQGGKELIGEYEQAQKQ